MADTKITDLTLGDPVTGDIMVYVSDPSGTPVTKKALAPISGTYTPTLGNVLNVAASTVPDTFKYYRVGSMVHVSGAVTQDATTAGTVTRLSITLPIASNFLTSYNANGTASASATTGEYSGAIYSNAADDTVYLQTVPISAANLFWRISFVYEII